MDATKQRSGFTKTGFSKSGFAACSHFNECLMGKLTCFYEEIDPEVKSLCSCYQRHHNCGAYSRHDRHAVMSDRNNKVDEVSETTLLRDSKTESNEEVEQLSLF